MYKMDKKIKEDMSGCDYYSSFIKSAIRQLITNGICYVYTENQVREITKLTNLPIHKEQNECGYTLSIPRKYREMGYYE